MRQTTRQMRSLNGWLHRLFVNQLLKVLRMNTVFVIVLILVLISILIRILDSLISRDRRLQDRASNEKSVFANLTGTELGKFQDIFENILSEDKISQNSHISEANGVGETKGELKNVAKLRDIIESNSLVFFLGSAVSLHAPSNLPTGDKMKNGILKALSNRIDGFARINGYLEKFMEDDSITPEVLYGSIHHIVGDRFFPSHDLIKTKDAMDVEHNINHEIVAKILSIDNLSNVVVTTNFDVLLENALEKQGRRKEIDYFVYSDDEGYRRYLEEHIKERPDKIAVIKIHGTIDNHDSMVAILQQTASGLSINQGKIIDHIMYNNSLLFIGYSGNDVDFFPKFISLDKNRVNGIYWNVRNRESKCMKLTTIFSEYGNKANYIVDDLAQLLKGMADKLDIKFNFQNKESKNSDGQPDHSKYFENWASTIEIYEVLLIIGILCINFGRLSEGKECYENALVLLKKKTGKKYEKRKAEIFAHLGMLYNGKGEFDEAVQHLNDALQIYKTINDDIGINEVNRSLGIVYFESGQLKTALKYFNRTMLLTLDDFKEKDIDRKIELSLSKGHYVIDYILLGHVYSKLNDFDKAESYYKIAVKLTEHRHESIGLANAYGILSVLYQKSKNYLKSLEYFKKSLAIYKQIGAIAAISMTYRNLGVLEHERNASKKTDVSKECFEKAFLWSKKIMDVSGMVAVADHHDRVNDLDESREYYQRIVEILDYADLPGNSRLMNYFDNVGGFHWGQMDIDSEIIKNALFNASKKCLYAFCYNKIGEIVGNQGNIDEAINQFQKARKRMGNKIGEEGLDLMIEIYKNLVTAYSALGKSSEAYNLEAYYLRPMMALNQNKDRLANVKSQADVDALLEDYLDK